MYEVPFFGSLRQPFSRLLLVHRAWLPLESALVGDFKRHLQCLHANGI